MKFALIATAISVSFNLIKCSKFIRIKAPLLRKSDEYDMNHINVVLQSLYPLCSLRTAVFDSDYQDSSPIMPPKSSSYGNPLELIFAKIYYDLENGKGATESSIYFTDSYLSNEVTSPTTILINDASPILSPSLPVQTGPIKFFHWLSNELFKDSKYRELMQWQLTTIFQGENDERMIEDNFDIFPIETFLSTLPAVANSLQSHLDDFFSRKTEVFSVTIDGTRQEQTRENLKEISNLPEILPFLISEPGISLDTSISLPNGNSYKLASVIYKESEEQSVTLRQAEEYSVALRQADDSWIRLHDDEPVQELSFDIFAPKALMAFYIYSQFAESSPCSGSSTPKPSQQLIMNCLTRNYKYSISKDIKRQLSTRNSPIIKKSSSLATNPIPTKSKQMQSVHMTQLSNSNFDAEEASSHSSTKLLKLPSRPIKMTPSDDDAITQQLKFILIPEYDLQLNLFTTASAEDTNHRDHLNACATEETTGANPKGHLEFEVERERGDSDVFGDDFELFKRTFTPKSVESDDGDFELEYSDVVPRTAIPSVWRSCYFLNDCPESPQHGSEKLESNRKFSDLREFEAEFNRGDRDRQTISPSASIDFELFKQAGQAKISKTRINGKKEETIELNSSKKQSSAASKQSLYQSRTVQVFPFFSSQDSSEAEFENPPGELKIKSTYFRF